MGLPPCTGLSGHNYPNTGRSGLISPVGTLVMAKLAVLTRLPALLTQVNSLNNPLIDHSSVFVSLAKRRSIPAVRINSCVFDRFGLNSFFISLQNGHP